MTQRAYAVYLVMVGLAFSLGYAAHAWVLPWLRGGASVDECRHYLGGKR